jgi:hypothetical protein
LYVVAWLWTFVTYSGILFVCCRMLSRYLLVYCRLWFVEVSIVVHCSLLLRIVEWRACGSLGSLALYSGLLHSIWSTPLSLALAFALGLRALGGAPSSSTPLHSIYSALVNTTSLLYSTHSPSPLGLCA